MTIKAGTATLIALVFSSQALAAPTFKTVQESGRDEQLQLEYEVSYAQVDGLERAAQAKINQALEQLAWAPVEGMRASLQGEDAYESDPDSSNGAYVGVTASAVNERLLVAEISDSTYWSGAAHPNTAVRSQLFDATTGEPVADRYLFASGHGALAKVAAKVSEALRAEYTFDGEYLLEDPTGDDLGAITPTQDGLVFAWGSYGLGAPYAMGPPTVLVPYAELAGLLNTDLLGQARRPSVDLGLGEDPEDFEGEAVDPSRLYIEFLHEDAVAALSGITVEERRALLADGSWRRSADADALIATLENMDLGNLADGVRDVLATTRRIEPLFEAIDFAALAGIEAGALEGGLISALEDHETGRVVTMGNRLLVRGEDPEGWGQAFAKLPHGTVVGVVERAEGLALYHTIRLANGRIGYVHKSYLLIETPRTVEGRVYRKADGSYGVGSPEGTPLIAKDGPGHPDAELDALCALVGRDGVSPPVRITAIQRERAFLRTWLAVVDFEEIPFEVLESEQGPSPAPTAVGIEDAVRQR
jgi:hypothetical protein